jgi:hypothetical protein
LELDIERELLANNAAHGVEVGHRHFSRSSAGFQMRICHQAVPQRKHTSGNTIVISFVRADIVP